MAENYGKLIDAKGWAPLPSPMHCNFGYGYDPSYGGNSAHYHTGIDLRVAYDFPYVSPRPMTITYSGLSGGYGILVSGKDDQGIEHRLAHCSKTNVYVGQNVPKGAVIAFANSTGFSSGTHLHWEVRRDGQHFDPEEWIADQIRQEDDMPQFDEATAQKLQRLADNYDQVVFLDEDGKRLILYVANIDKARVERRLKNLLVKFEQREEEAPEAVRPFLRWVSNPLKPA